MTNFSFWWLVSLIRFDFLMLASAGSMVTFRQNILDNNLLVNLVSVIRASLFSICLMDYG